MSHAAAAHHWAQSGDAPRAVREYLLAVEDAARSSESTRALGYLERAIELCESAEESDSMAGVSVAELRTSAAEHAMRVGRSSRAIDHARAAAVSAAPDPVLLGDRLLLLAEALRHGDDPAGEAEEAIDRALALIPDAISESRARALLGRVGDWTADPERAAELGDAAIELAELVGSPSLLAHALVIAGGAEMLHGRSLSESMLLYGRSIAEQSGDRDGVLASYETLATAHILNGRPGEGAGVALAGLARIPNPRQERAAHLTLAQLAITGLTLAGRWDEAGEVPAAVDGDGAAQDAVAEAEAQLWTLTGDLARARRALRGMRNGEASLAAGWLSFFRGDAGRLHRLAKLRIGNGRRRSATAHNETVFLAIAGRIAMMQGSPPSEAARLEVESLVAQLRRDPGGMPLASAWATLARAEAGALLSDSTEGQWRHAWDEWRQLAGWPHIRVYIECRLAVALGNSREAVELLTSALSIARRLGSSPLQRLCRGAAARISISPDTLGHAEVKTLTPREREVLDHIVEGASNRMIAVSLGVSEKTVSAHVSSLLQKFSAASRTELALWSRQMA